MNGRTVVQYFRSELMNINVEHKLVMDENQCCSPKFMNTFCSPQLSRRGDPPTFTTWTSVTRDYRQSSALDPIPCATSSPQRNR
ncbi:hypothetical protein J6590_018865 [Homalodisca vitripennis]|nr:hypothetical protein J6590_018865 [Homalodisca vitripennis]